MEDIPEDITLDDIVMEDQDPVIVPVINWNVNDMVTPVIDQKEKGQLTSIFFCQSYHLNFLFSLTLIIFRFPLTYLFDHFGTWSL
jgi:hypothetical protein